MKIWGEWNTDGYDQIILHNGKWFWVNFNTLKITPMVNPIKCEWVY